MDRGLPVFRRDLHRRVLRARRGPADEQRQADMAALHLLRDEDHLVERRRDEAAQADDVRVLVERGLQNAIAGHHHAQIDDLVAVAAQHDADDVLADIVHVALDGREHDLALAALLLPLLPFLPFLPSAARLPAAPASPASMNGCEVRDRLLHRPGALDHLRQEHLARAEQPADDLHAVHQRPLDHVERTRILMARLFDVRHR